jgi:yeast amino acid transporter
MEKGKGVYAVNETSVERGYGHASAIDAPPGVEIKDARLMEAAELYGDVETAEKYGYVTRG